MSPTSYQTAPPRKIMITMLLGGVKLSSVRVFFGDDPIMNLPYSCTLGNLITFTAPILKLLHPTFWFLLADYKMQL